MVTYTPDIQKIYNKVGEKGVHFRPEIGVSLGTTAKCSSPQENRASQGRAERYYGLSMARDILVKEAKIRMPKKYPGDVFRTSDCRYTMHSDTVGVHFAAEYQKAHYSGLTTCGSVWACPVCTSKIQERRRLEIEQAITWAKNNNYLVVMVTFTFPHYSFQSLKELIDKQKKSFVHLRSGKIWQDMKEGIGFLGLIRSLEVVHGKNGWHPHTHELWFIKSNIGSYWLSSKWKKACVFSGLLDPDNEQQVISFMSHSVDVRLNVDDGDYLAKQDDSRKWGLSHEMAKATSKEGRSKGVHPHHFLVRRSPGDTGRYIEYVDSMKGKSQLFWSRGLKGIMSVNHLDDEELADESRDSADLLASLSSEQWSFVRGNDARAELLDAAETGGVEAISLFLKSLGAKPL